MRVLAWAKPAGYEAPWHAVIAISASFVTACRGRWSAADEWSLLTRYYFELPHELELQLRGDGCIRACRACLVIAFPPRPAVRAPEVAA